MPMFAFAGLLAAINTSAGGTNDLQGTWISDCRPIGRNGRHGVVINVTIKGNRLQARAQMFATKVCDSATFKLDYRAELTTAQISDGSIALNHKVEEIALTPQAQEVVSQYNLEGDHGCGLQDWRLGVKRSVAGATCAPFSFPIKGTTLFDAAWITNGTLRLGAFPMTWLNTSFAKRPTSPGLVIYRRVARR